ncbi:hypothetical protein [Streptomyces avicenniae]|uniref:hypothetical protein n=1 Tax=Streptomyces avicenniae TaxID=500153 RepID=UPI00069AF46A|nr:hypothetical protein [Streptomyces avicenniae]
MPRAPRDRVLNPAPAAGHVEDRPVGEETKNLHRYPHLFSSLIAVSIIAIKEEKWIYVTN